MPRTDKRREARIAQYVDSPLMKVRVVDGEKLSARIVGSDGNYRVDWNRKSGRGSCTCPADGRPCKHIEALQRTWEKNPASFRNAQAVQAPDFPAERLVFSDAAGHRWACPCGTASPKPLPHESVALKAAEEHLARHAVHGGYSDHDILAWADEIQFAAHDRRLHDLGQEARQRFEKNEFGSMGDAVMAVAQDHGLEGTDGLGEVGELFRFLEQESGRALWNWELTSKEEALVDQAIRLAIERFISRKHKSMAEAAAFACKELNVRGDEEVGLASWVYGTLAENAPEVRRPSPRGGEEWESLSLKEWKPPSPERSKVIQATIARILKRFEAGLYEDLGDAILHTRNHFGLEGIEEEGETKLVFDLLAPNESEGRPPPKRSSVTLSQALEKVGLPAAYVPTKPPSGKCPGCDEPFDGSGFHDPDAPVLKLDGKIVHADFDCLNGFYGPEHSKILDLEAALAVEEPALEDPQEFKGEDDYLEHAKQRILERFELGLHDSMAEALSTNANALGLSEAVRGGNIWASLEVDCPENSMEDWRPPRQAKISLLEALPVWIWRTPPLRPNLGQKGAPNHPNASRAGAAT